MNYPTRPPILAPAPKSEACVAQFIRTRIAFNIDSPDFISFITNTSDKSQISLTLTTKNGRLKPFLHDKNDTHILKRDFTASLRLNCQHYIWLQELGYHIHPSITVSSLGESPRIADVATGTGAWLLEVSRSHPTATCDGFDISREV